MKHIPVFGGFQAIVDDEDYDYLSQFKWILSHKEKIRAYVLCTGKTGERRMHRIVMKANKGEEVDHINRNHLDNQKSNLRVCTRLQNNLNRGAFKNNKLGLRGVYKVGKRFLARIKLNGKLIDIGRYDSPEEAYEAHQKILLTNSL